MAYFNGAHNESFPEPGLPPCRMPQFTFTFGCWTRCAMKSKTMFRSTSSGISRAACSNHRRTSSSVATPDRSGLPSRHRLPCTAPSNDTSGPSPAAYVTPVNTLAPAACLFSSKNVLASTRLALPFAFAWTLWHCTCRKSASKFRRVSCLRSTRSKYESSMSTYANRWNHSAFSSLPTSRRSTAAMTCAAWASSSGVGATSASACAMRADTSSSRSPVD